MGRRKKKKNSKISFKFALLKKKKMKSVSFLNIPKPILIEIFCLFDIDFIPKLSLTCKKMEEILNTNNFWKRMVETHLDPNEVMKSDSGNESWKEIFKDNHTCKWDQNMSEKKRLKIEGRNLIHSQVNGLSTAFSKISFTTGEENYLLHLKLKSNHYKLVGAGIARENAYIKNKKKNYFHFRF